MKKYILVLMLPGIFFLSCSEEIARSDAYGHFEANEIMVSAEANGRILQYDVSEGQTLTAGQLIGYIDTMPMYLKKQQVKANMRAILSQQKDLSSQRKVYEEQRKNLEREKARVEKLLADGAATSKQLDDISGQIEVVDRQMDAHLTALADANRGISTQIAPLKAQLSQIEDQIQRCFIRNPMAGTVLVSYVELQEIAAMGRPLYKLADLTNMELRVYVQGNQLNELSIGKTVEILIDGTEGKLQSLTGEISWISSQAEFTPKAIQTRNERVNMVYAAKVKVSNPEGILKIGMPGEVNF